MATTPRVDDIRTDRHAACSDKTTFVAAYSGMIYFRCRSRAHETRVGLVIRRRKVKKKHKYNDGISRKTKINKRDQMSFIYSERKRATRERAQTGETVNTSCRRRTADAYCSAFPSRWPMSKHFKFASSGQLEDAIPVHSRRLLT